MSTETLIYRNFRLELFPAPNPSDVYWENLRLSEQDLN